MGWGEEAFSSICRWVAFRTYSWVCTFPFHQGRDRVIGRRKKIKLSLIKIKIRFDHPPPAPTPMAKKGPREVLETQ